VPKNTSTTKTNENRFIRDALRAFILKEPGSVNVPANMDWKYIDRMADGFNLSAILGRTIPAAEVPGNIGPKWKDLKLSFVAGHMKAMRAAAKMFALLDEAGVPAVGLRGPALVERIYPEAGLKPMYDVDILIPRARRKDVRAFLSARGLEAERILRTQLVYKLDSIIIEIHWSLLTTRRYMRLVDSEDFLAAREKKTTPEGDVWQLEPDMEFPALVIHDFAHHQLGMIMQLVDIALYMTHSKVDWQRLADWCGRSSLKRMVHFTLSLVNDFFDLGHDRELEVFGLKIPQWMRTAFKSYPARFFGGFGISDYIRYQRSLLYVAERWDVKIMQLARFLSMDELLGAVSLILKGGRLKLEGRSNELPTP
jgi:hypothetical protein